MQCYQILGCYDFPFTLAGLSAAMNLLTRDAGPKPHICIVWFGPWDTGFNNRKVSQACTESYRGAGMISCVH